MAKRKNLISGFNYEVILIYVSSLVLQMELTTKANKNIDFIIWYLKTSFL